MRKFIVANISSYIGQCVEAEHYYCTIYKNIQIDIDKNISVLHHCRTSFEKEELYKVLSKEDAETLNKKDNYSFWEEGSKVTRFNSIAEIKEELLKQFPNDNIVTYEDCKPHREMLIKIDGEIKSIDFLGEIWNTVPNSVWKDLLPEHFKVKCECGKEYSEEEVQELIFTHKIGNRELAVFDIDFCYCCKRPYLMWNVVL